MKGCYIKGEKFALLWLLLLFFKVSGYSQSVSYLGIENGLSNNTVTAIHKDKFGLMWFGTLDGINRYDGYSFKVFRNKYNDPTSLPNDIITAINSDNWGNIWVGTQKGVAVYENKTLQFAKVNYRVPNGKQLPVTNWINGIQKDSRGNMYIGANDIGLLLCQNGSKEATRIPISGLAAKLSDHYSVEAMSSSYDGRMWVAIGGLGLAYYDIGSRQLILTNKNVLSATCITPDILGNLWIGTKHGMLHYDAKTKIVDKFDLGGPVFNTAHISSIIFDKSKRLWIAIDGQGLLQISDIANGTPLVSRPLKGALSSDALFTIIEDDQFRKWIGTLRGGIQVIDERRNQFKTYSHSANDPNSLVNNFTFSFCEDRNGNVWIGTDGGGLSIWDRKQNHFKNYVYSAGKSNVLSNNRISSIVRDAGDNMWIGAYGAGVIKYNFDRGDFKKINFQNPAMDHSIWRLDKDTNGDIWVLCLRGDWARKDSRLFKFSKQTNSFISAPFDVREDILAITDEDRDNFWMGGFSGIMHANKVRGIDKVINLQTIVRTLHKSANGILWIGTYGRGLIAFDTKKNRFINYTEESGLCNNKVLNIEEDDKGNIWASTCNGISKVTPSTGKISNFYAADGLQSNQFYFNASAHLRSGELLFGGIKGFNIFNPDSIKQFHDFPPLIVSGIHIANSIVNAESEFLPEAKNVYTVNKITLPYEKAILSIDFAALEYSLPTKIQYAYLLKGKDKEWNNIGSQRSINYSQLNEGNYILKIRSTNASGLWNPNPLEINLTVLPPWYRSLWAYLLYLSLAALLAYIYMYYQKQKARLQYEVELSTMKAQQETELNEKKISFFTNIAHELRTPLTLILNPIKDLLNNDGQNINLVDVSSVHRNTKRLLSLVDQLMLFRSIENDVSELKPEVLNLGELCREVFLCFNNQVKVKSITCSFQNLAEELYIFADKEKIEIVLFNLISNAIKYTEPKSSVCFSLQKENGFAIMSVKNTGSVIPEDVGGKLFDKFFRLQQFSSMKNSGFGIGLFVSHRIAELQGGNLSYTSNADEGTVFVYKIPLNLEEVDKEVTITEKSRVNTELLEELFSENVDFPVQAIRSVSDNMNHVYEDLIENKPNVLIVDDSAEMRGYLSRLLKFEYNCIECVSADEALNILSKNYIDIIVSDIIMPGISGVEFCSRIKDSEEYSHIPVILLTGTSSPEVKLKGIECGADDYITKPFENELLIARIRSILKGRYTLKRYFLNEVTLQNNTEKVSEEYSTFLKKGFEIVEEHLKNGDFNVKVFIREMGMSRSSVYRKVKAISGLSITEFIRYIRLKKAAELMIQTDIRIKEVSYEVGINDPRYFREQFTKLFGIKPSEYIKKYRRPLKRQVAYISSPFQG